MKDYANAHTAIENADSFARSKLSEGRFAHTLRVADTAADLARVHGLDEDRARLSALIHDAAREIGPGEFLRLAEEWDVPV
jgi:HD superfamily phosphohydrolase YqeK